MNGAVIVIDRFYWWKQVFFIKRIT